MKLLLLILVIILAIFSTIKLFIVRKKTNINEDKCIVCGKTILSSNYKTCYQCSLKKNA